MKFYDMPIGTIMRVVDGIKNCEPCLQEKIVSFTGLSQSTVKKALSNATELGLIKKDTQGRYSIIAEEVEKGLSQEDLSLIFRKYLQQYKPFEVMCEYILFGNNPEECLRKTWTILDLPKGVEENLKPLIRWGIDGGILFKISGGEIKLKSEIVQRALPVSGLIEADLTNEMSTRLYIETRLTPPAYSFLDEVDKTLLIKALMGYSTNPDDCAEKAGQALEDFLRDIANAKGVDTSNCNGVVQIATKLRSKGYLHPKFINFVGGISTVRDACAHVKDKVTGKPWVKTPESAFQITLLSVTAVRAIYLWVFEGRQEI